MRLHIIGAPGAGKTTLAAALAARFAIPHVEFDDMFWAPSDPPYQNRRSLRDLNDLIAARLPAGADWILSGALSVDASGFAPRVTATLLLAAPPEIRLVRLRAREQARFGARILPGGDMEATHSAFLRWAQAYDPGRLDAIAQANAGRVVRLDASLPADDLATAADRGLGEVA